MLITWYIATADHSWEVMIVALTDMDELPMDEILGLIHNCSKGNNSSFIATSLQPVIGHNGGKDIHLYDASHSMMT